VLATSIGSVSVPLSTTFGILVDKLPFVDITPTWSANTATIIFDIRLPRVLLAGLVGAALAIAGATYQGLFRNPLADPYLIGVAQGASLGAVIGFMLPVSWNLAGFGLVPLLAFIGALLATTTVYLLARVGKALPVTTLILAGVALSALLSSIVSYLVISSGEALRGIIFWLMGSFSLSTWSEVRIVLPYVVVGAAVITLFGRMLNVMQLDEEQAQQLGVNVERLKIILLAAATLITAASVSFVGTIGFVGIIIPHAVRLVWGSDHRSLLPLAMLVGAIFMIFTCCDVARKPSFEVDMIELEMQNVALGYNHQPILQDINLKASPGELLGIIGPNGCGKSTLIKAFSRIIYPLSGTILVGGKVISGIARRELARLVGVVPQIPLLPSTFSAFEIVLMGRNPHLGLFQSEGPRDWDLAQQAMEKTATQSLAGRRVNELSGGEIQCLLIARALVQETKAILLDEPTANLDIGRQVEILGLMKDLCRSNKLTVLAALHDLNLAAQYCDRLILIHDGHIHAEGEPSQVITDANIKQVYGAENCVYPHPVNGLPIVLVGSGGKQ
jgi:iron complex transport system permease protein